MNFVKSTLSILILILITFLFVTSASASILVVDKEGEIVWKVLGTQDLASLTTNKSDIEVKNIKPAGTSDKSILLKKEDGGNISLTVGEENKLDVTNWKEDLLEIEERGEVQKINIAIEDGKFVIEDGEARALTELPINIDAEENKLALVTSSGQVYLSVLPLEALETSLRSKYLSKITEKNLQINEKNLGILTYTVKGEKSIKVFSILNFDIPVTTHVSASTGEIVTVDQPKWLSILGFLFN